MKKRILIIVLVIYLVASNTTYVYAEAATATIAVTGSIATGGLSASALVPYALPIVGGVLLGAGINVYLTNASEQAGMTKSEFIKSKINSYCDVARTTAGDFSKKILEGATIARDGTIQLTDQACTQINQFVNWLKSNNDVFDTSNTGSGSGQNVSIGGVNYPVVSVGESYKVGTWSQGDRNISYISGSGDLALVYIARNDTVNPTLHCFNRRKGNYSVLISGNANYFGADRRVINGYYDFSTVPLSKDTINTSIPLYIGSYNTFFDSLDGTFDVDNQIANPENDTFTGTQEALQGLGNILNPAPDKTTVLNPGLTGSLDIPGVQNPTIDVGDYLDALTRVLDRAGALDIPVTDPATGTIEQTRVTPTTYEPTLEKVDNPDLPDPTITNPAINPDDDGDPVQMAKPLAIQFKGVFPFCIPFDVKDMIGLLNATPEAPSYHVHWYIPFADTYLDFNVDLSSWNSTAAICRQMELLLFCIGLAFVTRSMFIRG